MSTRIVQKEDVEYAFSLLRAYHDELGRLTEQEQKDAGLFELWNECEEFIHEIDNREN